MQTKMQTKTHEYLQESDIAAFAGEYAPHWLRPGTVVALHGDLGAGKTALVRGFLRAVMQDDAMKVPSPTFTLVQEYETPNITIYHYDLYRMADVGELTELNWQQAIADGLAFVEWPERAGTHLPPHWRVTIQDTKRDNQRHVIVEAPR